MKNSKAWLTCIGREELAIVREHGWDSPDAAAKREEFKAAYQAVKHIRKCYEQEAHG
jgi:hypothetical protein